MVSKRRATFPMFVALVLVLPWTLPVGAQLYFSDDFEDPAASALKWEVISGDWQVADGLYQQLSTASPWQASMVASDHWRDEWVEYTIEFKVRSLTAGDAPVNVLFRVQDPAPVTWDDRNGPNTHMYRWIINGWTNTESRLYIYNEGTATMLTQTNNALEVGAWYHVKLVVAATGLAGYIDDIEMFRVQHAQWTTGRVGLHAYSGVMDFDDFIVYGPLGLVSAATPLPQDGAGDVPRDGALSWTPGALAETHDVYLGTRFADVNDASRTNPMGVLVSQGQTAATYDPGQLELGQTYYWRVDEVNGPPDYTIFKGQVWSFEVEPFAYPLEAIAVAASSFETDARPENTINGSGLDEDDGHSTRTSDMWLSSAAGDQPTFIEFTFDRLYKLHQMLVWNYNIQFEAFLGYGLKDVTVEYSENGVEWMVLGDFEFAQATSVAGYTSNTTIDFAGRAVQAVRLTANSNWGGVLPQYGLSEVRFLYIPTFAREPQPADGDLDVPLDAILNWRPGREAAVHEVYLGADPGVLTLVGTTDRPTLPTETLEFGRAYYWRVDEVNEAEPISLWQSSVWTFRTLEYAVIDDFESYTDDIDAGEAIFDTWLDGWVNNTGSTVGYLDAPFAERTVVHSGAQSMPLIYDNSSAPFYSEAERDLGGMAWNVHGADSLRLFVSGRADGSNDPEPFYVAVEDAAGRVAVVTHPDIAVRPGWNEWRIPFSDLTGVNLGNVRAMYMGLGDRDNPRAGGAGLVFIDDIGYGRSVPADD
ncbi:hypothetical protein [Anaerobaca lacustris]|uniref:F5/8 type C domain-containing protein n=1 Tax=Anaerobaca lacustris TaxID=3044600 RepID=A0AAW6U7F8_9BACT|nr:hypothetical protein [Sedimentisphaerales bacterium M17dextr]